MFSGALRAVRGRARSQVRHYADDVSNACLGVGLVHGMPASEPLRCCMWTPEGHCATSKVGVRGSPPLTYFTPPSPHGLCLSAQPPPHRIKAACVSHSWTPGKKASGPRDTEVQVFDNHYSSHHDRLYSTTPTCSSAGFTRATLQAVFAGATTHFTHKVCGKPLEDPNETQPPPACQRQ